MAKRLIASLALALMCATAAYCGINHTLMQAQDRVAAASTYEDYKWCYSKFASAKDDPGYVAAEHDKAIDDGQRRCEAGMRRLEARLTVDGSFYFNANGGTLSLPISTNQPDPTVGGLPSWASLAGISATAVTIRCSANSSTSSRQQSITVKAGQKSAKVRVFQLGKDDSQEGNGSADEAQASAQSSSAKADNAQARGPRATVQTVTVEHNTDIDGRKGMTVHVKFSVRGLKDKSGRATAYFYDASNTTPLRDTNGEYCTIEDEPKVAASAYFSPSFDRTTYFDFKIPIPYTELHQIGTDLKNLTVDVAIVDCSASERLVLDRKRNTAFSYTPTEDTYLTVENGRNAIVRFPAEGGTQVVHVATDATAWDTWGLPSFCRVSNVTASSFTITCQPNNGEKRNDFMKVRTASQEARIDIRQDASYNNRFERIWLDLNRLERGRVCTMVHMALQISEAQGHEIQAQVYFEHADGTPVANTDQYYGLNGQVMLCNLHVSPTKIIVNNPVTRWDNFAMYIPNDQFHLKSGKHELRLKAQIYDVTTKQVILTSDYQYFTLQVK